MNDDNITNRLTEDDGSLTGDALLHAVRRDMLDLFKALNHKVEALDTRVEALDAKVEARLRDTTPMWEVVVSRLDNVIAEQQNHGRRLDAIEGEQRKQGAHLDVIEGEIRLLRSRNERMIGQLSHDVIDVRAAQHDLEGRLEKLEKTPA